MANLARWCFRHRFVVIAIWVTLLVTALGLTKIIGTEYSDNFSLPNTDSTQALDLLKTVSAGASGETATIVWHVDNGTVNTEDTKQRINSMLDNVSKIPQVVSIISPYTPAGAMQISRDGRTAYAQAVFDGDFQSIDKENVKTVIATAQSAGTDNLEVEIGGRAVQQVQQLPTEASEAIGVLAAAIVLLIAFGSLYSMSIPLITALVALGIGTSVIGLMSHVLSVSMISPILGTLIGLGVGIDYALFIITRYRTGLLLGLKPEEATVKALDTAGRAVLFAGGTVCIALLGLLTLRLSFLGGVGVAASGMVLVTVFAAITLLPALLGVFKTRVLSRNTRRKLQKQGPVPEVNVHGFWAKNARFVERNSRAVGSAAMLIIILLIIPFFSLRLGSSDAGNDPETSTTRKSYDLLASGFGPGFNGPLQLVAEVKTPAQQTAFTQLAETVKQVPGVAAAVAVPLPPQTGVGLIQVIPTTSPESEETNNLINDLRDNVIPPAEGNTGLEVHVGGITAIFDDFAKVLTDKLPLFLAVIIGLGFLLLMVAFRSIVVPLTAAVMNVFAAGAAFGVVVAVFQWGWFSGILQTGGSGPVEAFLPVIMLAILFGLSMDYQVFLVSRMHEEWVHTKDNARSVRLGQAETGRVITAAALIMIFVFLSFALGGQRIIAEFGIGLASAVFIDAFVIRSYLVPAVMLGLGRANWWLPKWLDKILPHLAVEPMEETKK